MSLELSGTTPAIKGVAGSVSAPAITGDDADTGVSFPSANTIKFSTGGVERMSITDSGVTGTGIGSNYVKTSTTTKTDTASEAIAQGAIGSTDLISVSHAATSSSNKLIILVSLQLGMSSTASVGASLFIGGSQSSYRGDAAGSRQRISVWGRPGGNTRQYNFSMSFVVTSPSTSSTVYSVRGSHAHDASQTVYLNYSEHGDANYDARTASTITVMEVAA